MSRSFGVLAGALTIGAVVAALAFETMSLSRASAAETPIPPAPTAWVTDDAGLLSASTRESLNQRLASYERSSGHQVIVWIGRTTGDAPLEDWTIRSFSAWKVGRKKLDDGLALFIFNQDRKVRVEVGYGLEGQVTDAISSRIIRNDIVPRLKAGDGDAAVTAGVGALLATIGAGAGTAQPDAGQSGAGNGSPIDWVLPAVMLLFFLIFFMTSSRSALGNMLIIGSSLSGGFGGRGGFSGGGFGGGFGGFSGGGGMGGGGGASGSW
ncbi:MAG: TPM domain-containing protein [Candidatus Eremiobacteraeota bacterium]|nr:TPM domain-containing protein [Candidatus Eremiobacteraeota bacterium]MBC5826152.1 TPM domain-containing protein [Candidatus Eremiobacteraeota bacterium]